MRDGGDTGDAGSMLELVKQSYTPEKRAYDKRHQPFGYFVWRPISFYITVLFLKLGFSANQVTLLGVAAFALGLVAFTTGGHAFVLLGVVAYSVYTLLDYVDGNVARIRGTSSYFGMFLDGAVSRIVRAFFYLCISIGVYRNPDYLLTSWATANADRGLVLVLGALTSLFELLIRYLNERYARVLMVAGKGLATPEEEDGNGSRPGAGGRTSLPRKVLAVVHRSVLLPELHDLGYVVLVAMAVPNLIDVFLVLYLLLRMTHLLLDGTVLFYRAHRQLSTSSSSY